MGSSSSDRAWVRWGETDPYFAVLTGEEFRSQSIGDRKAAFFSSGEEFIEQVLGSAARQFPAMGFGRALDFGCGVGRLTLPLARRFGEAVGLDVSPAMLREAQANAGEAGLANVLFRLSDDGLTEVDGEFDFVNTCIVLQHIPVRRGMAYIDRLLSLLRRGGIAHVHFTIDRQQGPIRNLFYWGRVHVPLVHRLANLLRGRPAGEPLMQMNEYSLPKVLQLFDRHGIVAPTVQSSPQGSTLSVFLMGQKI